MMQTVLTRSALVSASEHFIRPLGIAADAVLGSRGCLFAFHRAAPSSVWETLPNREFYLDLGFLDQVLSYVVRAGWKVVTIEEALRRSLQSGAHERYVNFSVDDCYRDTFESVVPLFRRHGVPVTLFVTTGIPDGTLPLWCAGLEDTLLNQSRVLVEDGEIEVASPEAKRKAYARIAQAWDGPDAGARYEAFCERNRIDAKSLHWKHAISWDMLDELSHDSFVEIGSHGVMHGRISSLDHEAALAELAGGRERLVRKLSVAARHFAFPYGRSGDCGPRDFELARRAGLSSAATTRKGLIRRGQNPFSLPRNTLNGSHRNLAAIEMHLTGFTGVAARMLGRV